MYKTKRIRQHLAIGLCTILTILGIFFLMEAKNIMFRVSMATAYASFALIGCSLALGPWNIFRNRPNPVHSDLRRDIGIWGGMLGIIHVVFGFQRHMGGKFWLYFFYPEKESHLIPLRYDTFGFANYTGLGSTLVLILLLALSNNVSLRKLGTQKWKSLQRWNYVNFLLIILHGAAYQFLVKRSIAWVAIFLFMVVVVVIFQAGGFSKVRGGVKEVMR